MKTFAAASLILVIGPLGACESRSAPAPSMFRGRDDPAVDSYVAASMAADGMTLLVRVTAPAAGPLHLENCNGAFPWGLERREGGVWTTAWVAELNGCLSEPIVVPPGEIRDFGLPVLVRPGDSLPAGTYRVAVYALHDAALEPGASDHPVPPESRVSRPFPFGPVHGPGPSASDGAPRGQSTTCKTGDLCGGPGFCMIAPHERGGGPIPSTLRIREVPDR